MNLVYIRVSTSEQDEQQQLKPIIDTFKLNEYVLISEKQTAFKEEKEHLRSGLNELKDNIVSRKYNKLYIFALDRLFRNRTKQKEFMEFLKIYNVELYSYSQKFLNDIWKMPKPYNEMFYNFLIDVFGHMAEEESRIKSDRVKKAYNSKNRNKWGRPGLNLNIDRVWDDYVKLGSMKRVAEKYKISLGSVHKITQQKRAKIVEENSLYDDD